MRNLRTDLKIMLGAASLAACLACSSALTQAGSLGGAVGGAVGGIGGAVGGVGGAVGGTVGGAVGAVGGAVSSAGDTISGSDTTSSSSTSSTSSTTNTVDTVDTKKKGLTVKAKLKLKKKTVKTNFNANLLGENSLVNAKAKVQVGNLAKVKAGAKVLADDGTLVGAKAKIGVGGSAGLKAGVGATVGTNGIGANVAIGLGEDDDNTTGTPGGVTPTPKERKAIASQISSLSNSERVKLKKKCGAVLASPASYSRDAALLCRVMAELSVSQAN